MNKVRVKDAMNTIRDLSDIVGDGFHPDTPIADYVDLETGKATFDKETATELQEQLDYACFVLSEENIDPCEALLVSDELRSYGRHQV